MKLRTRIFRQLVIFALVPSLILAAVACYFLLEAIQRAGHWRQVASPDRTINSMRLIESLLQETVITRLRQEDANARAIDSTFDWHTTVVGDSIVGSHWPGELSSGMDTALTAAGIGPGLIRRVVGGKLILGGAVKRNDTVIAGGFVLGREYLSGFEAASATLSESRSYQNLLPGLALFLIVAGGGIMILVIAGAYFFSRRLSVSVTNPLEYLTRLTAGVAAGEKQETISVSGTEEITRLTDTFNRMVDDLEKSRRRLAAVERVAAWQDFARRMAHEIKNPLTPITLSLYRIRKALEKSDDYEKYAESIEAISSELKRLERLATDYSSLASLPAPDFGRFDIAKSVRDLLKLHETQLEKFDFEFNIPTGEVIVEGDGDHLRQVMLNLIKNAMEFTAPEERIRISLSADENRLYFEAANRSGDVSEEDLRAARMPYVSTRKGGTGLGLAISEKIVIDHGGSLVLEIRGGFTVARFEIPRFREAYKEKEESESGS